MPDLRHACARWHADAQHWLWDIGSWQQDTALSLRTQSSHVNARLPGHLMPTLSAGSTIAHRC